MATFSSKDDPYCTKELRKVLSTCTKKVVEDVKVNERKYAITPFNKRFQTGYNTEDGYIIFVFH